MKTITLQQLRDLNACEPQLRLFEQTFGQSVEVTVDLCAQYTEVFDFHWASEYLLQPALNKIYRNKIVPARAEYEAKRAPLWQEYKDKQLPTLASYRKFLLARKDTLTADYKTTQDFLWAECEAKLAVLLDDYKAKLEPLLIDYRTQRAKLFAELYLAQPEN